MAYKSLNLSQLGGLDFTQDLLAYLQDAFQNSLDAVASIAGDYVILSGVVLGGGSYTDGWVAINGEILPFQGGLSNTQIVIQETVAQEHFSGDGTNKDVYTTRIAKLGSTGGTPIANFVRLDSLKSLTQNMALKAPLASPALTGNPTAPTQTAGNNSTRLATTAFVATAIANLINSAPGALDTLKELADALGDDPNYAATVTAALAGKLSNANGAVGTNNVADDAINNLKIDTTGFRGQIATPTEDVNNAEIGTIQLYTGAATNSPTGVGADHFIITTLKGDQNGSKYQLAQQVAGANKGDIYERYYPLTGPYGAWTLINDASA